MLGEMVPKGSARRISIRESSAEAAKGATRLSQTYPAPAALSRMNCLRPIKSRYPLSNGVGTGRQLELRPSSCDRRLVQVSRRHLLRRLEAIERLEIVARQKDGRQGFRRRLVLPIYLDGVGLRQIPVQNEERDFAVLRADRSGHIQVRNLSHARNFVAGRLNQKVQDRAAGKLQRPAVRIVDCLPEQTIRVGHDRGEEVDQLSQARQ